MIHVAGGKSVPITVRTTRHGPVLTDVIPQATRATPAGLYVLSLETTFLQGHDTTVQAMWEMNRARNWQQFKQATRDFVAPEMNMVFADTNGTIAFTAPARLPIRKHGEGWIPRPGWTGKYDWTGYVPFDALPRAVNPKSGQFVTANNKIVPSSYPYFITRNWVAPYRADRIAGLLERKPVQSPAYSEKIQADTVSLAARQLLPLMLKAEPLGQPSEQALTLLRAWHGNMSRNKAAPLIFIAWVRAFGRALFGQRLGRQFNSYWGVHARVLHDVLTRPTTWCLTAPMQQPRSCERLLSVSLQTVVQKLRNRYGGTLQDWRWGRAHRAFFSSLIDHVPVIGGWFRVTLPVGGSQNTIDAGYMNFADRRHPFQADTGPSLRMVLNFADLSKSAFLMAPGVSGNVFSTHYDDLLKRWRGFRYIIPAAQPAVHKLVLLPATVTRHGT